MREIIRKVLLIVVVMLFVMFLVYIITMAILQDPIVFDMTTKVCLNPELETIELPWIVRLLKKTEVEYKGTDTLGNKFSCFSYDLPPLFENVELNIIVSWHECRVTLFIGEGKAMDMIEDKFPLVVWNE